MSIDSAPATTSGKDVEVFSSPALLSDEEILALGVPSSEVEMYRRKAYQAHFGVETWYSPLQEHTFPTEHVPITYQEAQAIIKAHQTCSELRSSKRDSLSPGSNEMAAFRSAGLGAVTYPDVLANVDGASRSALQNLASRLDKTIARSFRHGCFAKLNTRSPKDVVIYDFGDTSVQACVDNALQRLSPEALKKRDEDAFATAFVKGSNRAMQSHNGVQIMRIFVLSTRVAEDLTKMVQFGERVFNGSEGGGAGVRKVVSGASIVLREWQDSVVEHPEGELRGFVHMNELNCLTQYFSFIEFPQYQITRYKKDVEDAVRTFFRECVRDALKSHQSYVIDFCVVPAPNVSETGRAMGFTKNGFRVQVVELNPFHKGAGAALFNWRDHRELFMHGPFEFRTVGKEYNRTLGGPCDGPLSPLPSFWQKYVRRHVSEKLNEPYDVEEANAEWREKAAYMAAGGAIATAIAVGIVALIVTKKR